MSFKIEYKINNPRMGYPARHVDVEVSENEIAGLVEQGFLVLPKFLTQDETKEMREALDDIFTAEAEQLRKNPSGECFGGVYLRYLMDKHSVFLNLYKKKSTLSIARAVLGPQVQFDQVDARVVPANSPNVVVSWHIHMRVVPEPLPPFFSYPHAIHCLLYLDDVNQENGPLCVLPGSHQRWHETYSAGDASDKPGQIVLSPAAGTCLMMHGNLWHKTLPSSPKAGLRRLVFFGYMPSWMRWNEKGGIEPERSLIRDELIETSDPEAREVLGEFYWG